MSRLFAGEDPMVAIDVAIGAFDGLVVVSGKAGRRTRVEVRFSPGRARELASAILQAADYAESKTEWTPYLDGVGCLERLLVERTREVARARKRSLPRSRPARKR